MHRATLLFYCQHSLGIGHLTRSFALAAALSRHFRVVFLNGGRLPAGVVVPNGIERIDLPPLGMDDGHTVVSRDGAIDVNAARAERRRLIDAAVATTRPSVLLVELFPFGRKKFAGEILPMIRAVRGRGGRVVCSLRDILVDARPDQQQHDDRARWLTDRYFDAVLVHSDARFARLEDSFRPARPLATPVHYTGFVVPERADGTTFALRAQGFALGAARRAHAPAPRGEHLLVSAGGGIVGAELFHVALQARALLPRPLPMKIIAGPFLPEPAWQALQRDVADQDGVEVVRHVGDMVAEMRRARASISQCGYNTALDIVVAGVPALVVPYETKTENEQSVRAARLDLLGVLTHLPAAQLNAPALAAGIDALLGFTPRAAMLELDGAERTASIVAQIAHAPERAARARRAAPSANPERAARG